MAIGVGTEQIGKLMNAGSPRLNIGERDEQLTIQKIVPGNYLIQAWETDFEYHIRKWLALSQDNYAKYETLETVVERVSFLEGLLIGNILSMCKGLGITIERQINCKITHISDPTTVRYKGNPMMSFDADFLCNVSLPDYIGLGKAVSLGHGTVVRKYQKEYINQQ